MLNGSHLTVGGKSDNFENHATLIIRYSFFTQDFIMKTEAIRIATTFDVSYKMRIGSERINQFVKHAESDENNVSISKFLKLLKNL